MLVGLFAASLLFLLPIAALAGPHASGPLLNRHHDLARRAEANMQLHSRQSTHSRWSFYETQTGSAGSCGDFLSDSGFTVAVNAAQMNSGMCHKSIVMSYNGISATAIVEDTCPGCPYGGLDLSPALFQHFASLSVGIIYGEWHFADAAPAPPPAPKPSPTPPPPPPPPKPSPPPPPPPPIVPSPSLPLSISISLWSSPTPQSQSHKPAFTQSSASPTGTQQSSAALTSSSVSNSSSVSINYSSGAASGLAIPTGTPSVPSGTGENIENLYMAFVNIAALVMAAHED